ncbi:hypothetical protein [Streptomyces sp. CRN 30]|uniref:hypothetical protein n=1 Tax=Streptomyces sp. CRN 30 TaxID=3075613 RepID=UPI002A838849|nr:hypothetical protein [Streptomyces sp. CRN 30]
MSGTEAVVILLWWSGVAALVFWTRRRKARKKSEQRDSYGELRSFAEGRGWRYDEVVPGLVDTYKGNGPFWRWTSGVPADHVVSGAHGGFGFRAFETQFGGDALEANEHVHVLSVCVLDLGVDVPDLRVYRDGWFDTLVRGRAMTVGIPQLDKDFHIVSRDEERARTLLLGGLAEFLVSDGRAAKSPLHLSGGRLFTWREETRLSTETLSECLEYLADTVGHLGVTAPDQPTQTP